MMWLKKFETHLFALTILMAGIVFLLTEFATWFQTGNIVWAALFFFVFLTWGLYRLAVMSYKTNSKTFTYVVLGSMAIRMIFSIFFIVIYLIFSEERSKVFILSFMLFYILYSMLEILHLVFILRPETRQGSL